MRDALRDPADFVRGPRVLVEARYRNRRLAPRSASRTATTSRHGGPATPTCSPSASRPYSEPDLTEPASKWQTWSAKVTPVRSLGVYAPCSPGMTLEDNPFRETSTICRRADQRGVIVREILRSPDAQLKGRTFKGLRGWSGKPLHPPLTDFPIAAYVFAAVFDVFVAHRRQASRLGARSSGTPVPSHSSAVPRCRYSPRSPALWDAWKSSEAGTQARRTINTHATIMVTVTVLALADIAWRLNDYHTELVDSRRDHGALGRSSPCWCRSVRRSAAASCTSTAST